MSEPAISEHDVETEVVETTDVNEDTRLKIIYLLGIYPYLQRSMIQTGLSPALPPKLWGPILDGMLERGEICKQSIATQAPSGRSLSKEVYHLPSYPYPPMSIDMVNRVHEGAQIESLVVPS